MVPVVIDGKPVRKHSCIDGPELDDWDKYLPHFEPTELDGHRNAPFVGEAVHFLPSFR